MQATEVERYFRRIIDKHHNLVVQRHYHCRALQALPKEIHKGSASLELALKGMNIELVWYQHKQEMLWSFNLLSNWNFL